MNLKPFALLLILALLAEEESVCVHPTAGAVSRISLDDVRKAQESVKDQLRLAWEDAGKLSLDRSFDSGLPSCPRRETRSLKGRYPRELLGRSIAFARADRMPKADVRVATQARRLVDAEVDALADPALQKVLGIRCVPTMVRVMSEVELELVEGD